MLGMDLRPQTSRMPIRCLLAGPLALLLWASALTAVVDGQDRKVGDVSWDPQRYIGLDEIKAGMEAYCLTDYGNGVEKFAMKVIDVMRDVDPGRDLILVIGIDDRLSHTGPAAGCSGSPLYIGGRLAGALAYSPIYAKDPLYMATAIKDMLEIGDGHRSGASSGASGQPVFAFDFSEPMDVIQVGRQILKGELLVPARPKGVSLLPCPLVVSGLPMEACEPLISRLEAMGLVAAPGLGGGDGGPFELKPGSALTVPLVTGDIKMDVLGTVTEVRGDRVYGFGHSYLGYGPLNLPMAGGKVHTVVSRLTQSIKLATAGDIIGAITWDESTGIVGNVGAKPQMLPLSIRVERYNDSTPRLYKCQIVDNRVLTAQYAPTAIEAAALRLGDLPPDNTVEYDATIAMDDGQSVRFSNTATRTGLDEPLSEFAGALGLLRNNPFDGAKVKSLDFDVRVRPKNIASHIWSVDVRNTKIHPGDDISIDVVVESYLVEKRVHHVTLHVPKEVNPGKYTLMLMGTNDYESFLRKSAPFKFVANNYQTLVDALNEVLNVGRTKLYCVLSLPPSGISLERGELPDLPATKAMVLQNDKRAVKALPYPHWVEEAVETGTVISDRETIPIVVEDASR